MSTNEKRVLIVRPKLYDVDAESPWFSLFSPKRIQITEFLLTICE